MAKKIEESEVKKECPSCGLGVALDSKICEFCGWDFEEEDEWILQIEKLERELMLEKKRFEPGSVDQKIEATLYTPSADRVEPKKPKAEEPAPAPEAGEPPAARAPTRTGRAAAPSAPSAPGKPHATRQAKSELADAFSETIGAKRAGPEVVREQPVAQPAAGQIPVRRVRAAKAAPASSEAEARGTGPTEEPRTRKVRVVRKVKK